MPRCEEREAEKLRVTSGLVCFRYQPYRINISGTHYLGTWRVTSLSVATYLVPSKLLQSYLQAKYLLQVLFTSYYSLYLEDYIVTLLSFNFFL